VTSFPNFRRLFGRCRELSPSNKLAGIFLDHFPFLLGQRHAAERRRVRAAIRKRLADLQNMFLIDNQAIGAFQALLRAKDADR